MGARSGRRPRGHEGQVRADFASVAQISCPRMGLHDARHPRYLSFRTWLERLAVRADVHIPCEPHIRTTSRQYLRYAMLLRTTPMPYTALHRYPNAAMRFSVTHWNCFVEFVHPQRSRHDDGTATEHHSQGGSADRQTRADADDRVGWPRSSAGRSGPPSRSPGRTRPLRAAAEGSPADTPLNIVEA